MSILSSKEFMKSVTVSVVAIGLTIIMLIPVMIVAQTSARKTTLQNITYDIENGFAKVCQEIEAINTLLYNLRYNSIVYGLSTHDDHDPAINIGLLNYKTYMTDISFINTIAQDIYIQFRQNNIMLSSRRIFTNKAEAYGSFISYEDITFSQWQHMLFVQKAYGWGSLNVYSPEFGWTECLTINQFYSMSISPSIVCSAIIPTETVINLLKANHTIENGFLYLTDLAQNVLIADNIPASEPLKDIASGPAQLAGQDFEVIVLDNRDANLHVVIGVPEYLFREASRPVTRLIYINIILAIGISIILSSLYIYNNNKPLYQLLTSLNIQNQATANRQNVYHFIGELFSSQNAKMEKMRQDYQKMLYSFEFLAFEHAIIGLQMKEDELLVLNRNIVFNDRYLLLILSRVHSDEVNSHESEFFTIVKSIFERTSPICYFQSLERFIIVMPDDQQAGGRHNELLALCQTIMQETGIHVKISSSMAHMGVESLEYAYEEARQALNTSLFADETPVTIYERSSDQKTATLAPFSKYREISELILAGDGRRLTELFSFFKDQMNIGSQTLRQNELMLDNIASAIESAIEYFPNHEGSFMFVRHSIFPAEEVCQLEKLAMAYCDEVRIRKTSQVRGRSIQIMEYIAENYQNPEMGLNHLAGVFKITESYISSCIKEHTGKNYTEHIESLRMNKAMQLLVETKVSIAKVARSTGYANINTFYKAFKKVHHYPPNYFRSIK